MPQITNNLSGVPDGAAISTANSGGISGQAFDGVNSSGGAFVADGSVGHSGWRSAKCVTSAAGQYAYGYWGSSLGANLDRIWFAACLYFASLPEANCRCIGIWHSASAGSLCGSVQVTPTGLVRLLSSSGSPMATTTKPVTAGHWFRAEGLLTGSAAAGHGELRLFLNPDSATPDETVTSEATFNTFGTIGSVGFGQSASSAAPCSFNFDNVGVSTTGYFDGVAGANTMPYWILTGWNAHLIYEYDPANGQIWFDQPGAFGTGDAGSGYTTKTPVQDGFAMTPLLLYQSFATFENDVNSGAIMFPYQWVMYDIEHWDRTPVPEYTDPWTYMNLFGQFAHEHGYKVIITPARDLGNASPSANPKLQGETLSEWYVRTGVAGAAAAHAEIVLVQTQVHTADTPAYQALYNSCAAQVADANPQCLAFAEVSTNYGDADQMIAAAQSVSAPGYYTSITSAEIAKADAFYRGMTSPAQ